MQERLKNYAYIDGANLHKGIKDLGWNLDHKRFREFLRQKYKVKEAYYFVGYLDKNAQLYKNLQKSGYIVVLKPTVSYGEDSVKGNCDVDIAVQAVSDSCENKCEQAVIVTSDGDFATLALFLAKKSKLRVVLSPSHKTCSYLLRQNKDFKLTFIEEMRDKLEYRQDRQKKKTPPSTKSC